MPAIISASPDRNLIRVAEQKPAEPADLGGHDGVADPRGDARGDVEGFDGAVWVGESQEVGDAARQPAARPLLALDVLEEGGGGPQPLGRGQPGVGALGPVAGRDQPLAGARIAGCLEVVGDRVGIGARARGERLADPAVPQPPARRQDAFVERLAGEGVDEADAPAIRVGLQQVGVHRPLDDRQQRLIVEVGHLGPERERHLLPDHGGHRQRHARRLAEPGDAAIDHVPEEGRDHDAVEFAKRPAIVRRAEQRFLLQRPEELGREQRVALGVPVQVGDQARLVRGGKAVAGRDEGAQGGRVEAPQIEPEPVRLAHQRRKLHGEGVAPRQLVAPVGDEQQDRPVPQAGGEMPEELQAGGIGPMEIFEQEEGRTGGGERGEERADLGEERGLVGHGLQPAARRRRPGAAAGRGRARRHRTGRARGRTVAYSSGRSRRRSARGRPAPPPRRPDRGPAWSCRCPLRRQGARAGRAPRARRQAPRAGRSAPASGRRGEAPIERSERRMDRRRRPRPR